MVNGDLLDEANETYCAQPHERGRTRRSSDAQGLGTITDDDPLPALSINDVTVTEGDSGTVSRDLHGHAWRRSAAAR